MVSAAQRALDIAENRGYPSEFGALYALRLVTPSCTWTGAPFPVLTVRYEDLLADTAGQLGRIARFAHHERASDRGRLARAVAHSAFSRLRENEGREGYKGALHGRFFRSGATGD